MVEGGDNNGMEMPTQRRETKATSVCRPDSEAMKNIKHE